MLYLPGVTGKPGRCYGRARPHPYPVKNVHIFDRHIFEGQAGAQHSLSYRASVKVQPDGLSTHVSLTVSPPSVCSGLASAAAVKVAQKFVRPPGCLELRSKLTDAQADAANLRYVGEDGPFFLYVSASASSVYAESSYAHSS